MVPSQKRFRVYYAILGGYTLFQFLFFYVLRLNEQDTHTNAIKILEIYKKLSLDLNTNSILDNSGLYKMIHTKKLEVGEPYDVSLISQCSSNHFSQIEGLFNAWEGPISIAVYTEIENVEMTLWDVARFMHCYRWRNFGMHVVIPTKDVYVKDHKFAYSLLSESDNSISCNSPYVSVVKERKNYNLSSPYPVNLLRNIARSGISTDFIFTIDIDMLPSPNLREGFLNFTKTEHFNPDKAVYVVPIFEILPVAPIPKDKKMLLEMVGSNLVRQFYLVPCEDCQKLTKYKEWMEREHSPGMKTIYQVDWKHPWEPFFIAKNNIPHFDERFKQYGMNRVSQICELHVAGFKFLVLDNGFLIHKGFKTGEEFHVTKNTEMETNRKVYARFKIEIRYKYPDSNRSC